MYGEVDSHLGLSRQVKSSLKVKSACESKNCTPLTMNMVYHIHFHCVCVTVQMCFTMCLCLHLYYLYMCVFSAIKKKNIHFIKQGAALENFNAQLRKTVFPSDYFWEFILMLAAI